MRDAVQPVGSQLRLTLAGKILLPVGVASLVAAWIAGGVMILFAATAWALFLLGALGSWLQLSGIEVHPPACDRAFVGKSFETEVVLRRRGLPLAARDLLLFIDAASTDRPAGHVPELGSRAPLTARVVHRYPTRGRRRSMKLALASSFPFGIVRCAREYELDVDILVLPSPARVGRLPRVECAREEPMPVRRALAPADEEAYGVREWREGESVRHVHWKLSARRQRLILQEFRDQKRAPVHVILSTRVPKGVSSASFEQAVRLTASLCAHFARRKHRLQLSCIGGESRRMAGGGRGGLLRMLGELAEVRSHAGNPLLDVFCTPDAAGREEVFVVCASGGAEHKDPAGKGRRWHVFDVDDPLSRLLLESDPREHFDELQGVAG